MVNKKEIAGLFRFDRKRFQVGNEPAFSEFPHIRYLWMDGAKLECFVICELCNHIYKNSITKQNLKNHFEIH